MSIASLTSAQTQTENRRPAARRGAAAGGSFQEQLAQTAAAKAGAERIPISCQAPASEDTTAETPVSKLLSQGNLSKGELLSLLFEAKAAFMKAGKEKKEENDEWQELMDCVDAWIESIQEDRYDVEKAARAYAALEARRADKDAGRKDVGDLILLACSGRMI